MEKLERNYKELQMRNWYNDSKKYKEKVNLHLWRTVIKKQVIKYSKTEKGILNDANDGMHVNEKNNRQNKQI